MGPRRDLRSWLRLAFLLRERVGRREYLLVGLTLAAVKYLGEVAFVRWASGALWTPREALQPVWSARMALLVESPEWVLWALSLWTVPFVWVGASMTVRRAVDAGTSPWVAMFFFVPFVNLLLLLVLACVPTHTPDAWHAADEGPAPRGAPRVALSRRGRELLGAAGLAALVGLATVLVAVHLLRAYPAGLFLGAPFLMGVVSAFLDNRRAPRPLREALGVAILSLLFVAGGLFLLALEGAVCLAMAFPLGVALALPGAVLGRAIARHTAAPAAHACLALFVLPLQTLLDPQRDGAHASEVRSAIEIDAPPDRVWEQVVAFFDLPPPHRLVFALGIAYPVRARIEVLPEGAVRYCEFSTGAFVEPITCWDPPRRLAFDVVEQPPPMREWSVWERVHAPHLDGFLRSQRGEFRLVPLPGGRTRLEGSTWFEVRMQPGVYWGRIAEAVIHAIHMRVLENIAERSEARGGR